MGTDTSTETDPSAVYEKYAEERAKRLRADGNDQYVRVSEKLPNYGTDPHMPVEPREPLTDHVTFAFIGGGFAGLLAGARLKGAGVNDVRIIDKAGDFGGVWYWNRYPGAMCDTSSFVYMPLLEETGHMPTEKYAHGPEIREHCRRIGQHFGLYDEALFHTAVTAVSWDESNSVWLVETDRGDRFTAQFLGIGVGPLHVAKLPNIPGIDEFAGHAFHTTQWDFEYTGGDSASAPMTGLADKKVAIIGTGATALQAVPELARSCGDLYVVQRTPTSVDLRGNAPIDPDWFGEISAEPGWQARWLENFTANWDGYMNAEAAAGLDDLIQDGWTDLGRRFRDAVASVPVDELSPERIMQAIGTADLAKMEAIRSRVDDIVENPSVAEHLKAWYSQLCKRPGFHDEYLQSFNRPHVHMVNTDGKGVERITERGIVVGGEEIAVDCIIYATGFEYATDFVDRTGFTITGRGGRTLADHWDGGMRTLHGMHVHQFPNLFLVQMLQAAFLGANVPHNYTDAALTIAAIVKRVVDSGGAAEEVTADAEQAWVEMLLEHGRPFGSPDCTPGYYNNEGSDIDAKARHSVGYPMGAAAFFALMDAWRADGEFAELNLT